uniref:uncharacterized protein LOC120329024 isoform X1 n=1 Tax=Styela clava TaxID=7725 RepID=UPI00193ABBE5|nr:uncharacterized protein LOC120329024 isoform X1 [Styela clava]
MYEKLTSRLKKGYKVIKNSSKSLRRYSSRNASSSQSDKLGSQTSTAKSVEDAKDPCHSKLTEVLKERDGWEAIFENDRYKNWLKVGIALRCTCDAVASLVDKLLIEFHLELRDKYTNNARIGWQREFIREVSKLHRESIKPGEVWRRSDVNKWLSVDYGPWEIAKVFMPKGSRGSSNIFTAKDFDATGLMNFMTQFRPFENYVTDLGQVHRVRQIRNKTMHSPRLEFTVEELNFCFDEIQVFLNDEVLQSHFTSDREYNQTVENIEKIKLCNFNVVTTIKSSFDVLEDRLDSEKSDEAPYPAAMSSNRELLRSLRRVFASGEVKFTLNTKSVEEKLNELEILLSEQQSLAEEKITLLFSKANYLRHQLDRVSDLFVSNGRLDEPQQNEKYEKPTCFNSLMLSDQENKRKKNKKRNRKNKRKSAEYNKLAQKKSSHFSLKVKKSRLYVSNKKQKSSRPYSVPNLKSMPISNYIGTSASNSKFLLPQKTSTIGAVRYKSTETTDDTFGSADTTAKAETLEKAKQQHVEENNKSHEAGSDIPGPSGLQDSETAGSTLGKRKSSTSCLIPSESVKKKLMIPFNPIFGKKKEHNKNNGRSIDTKQANCPGEGNGTTGVGGGGGSKAGHFQKILKNLLIDQSAQGSPVYEDRRDGEYFNSTVKFQTKFVVKSKVPNSSPEEAEIEAAVQALKKFGLEVGDRKNAKAVLNQFCEAAVGTRPNYHTFLGSSKLHIGVAQIHSLFASWSTGVDSESDFHFFKRHKFTDDILLQVKTIDSVSKERENAEQSCARIALQEANIDESKILNFKKAANELCLRDGGTLPIYETARVSKRKESQMATTMTSFAREKLTSSDSSSEKSSTDFDIMPESFLSDDVLLATSEQPSYTQDQAEEAAAKCLLEKMGVVVSPATADVRPYTHVLRENAVQWGYHPPQYHTFEVKPQIDLGQVYFAVVSSRALHKFMESMSAESDSGMTTMLDARESAARKALLMLGYPQIFQKV